MKNKLLISKLLVFAIMLISFSTLAQVPQKMSNQAVVRDLDNELVANSEIGVRISIIENSEEGVAVYTETHQTNSNENGLISITIGLGTTSDDFTAITWSSSIYFLKTEIDPDGGSYYSISGTSQLLSVPYALYSKTSESIPDGNNVGDMLYWDGEKWTILPVGKSRTALILCNGVPTWGGCDENNEPILVVENINGVDVFSVYGDGVVVNVPENYVTKSGRGGFAVGGYTSGKLGVQDYLLITPDSVRVYVKEGQAERSGRGGFAVGGFTAQKEKSSEDFLKITSDSIFVTTTLIATGNINVTGDLNIGGGIINVPLVQTVDVFSENDVYFAGQILDNGGGEIIEIGFVYGLTDIPDSEWTKYIVDLAVLTGGFFDVNIDPSVFIPETSYFVRAFAKNNAGSGFGGIFEFIAPIDVAPGTVTDEDANVYQTLYIAENRWMVENLKTTKYNDGAPITTNLEGTDWGNNMDGAFAIYPFTLVEGIDSDEQMKLAYGLLYNWYAVNTNMLCPAGWRVPTAFDYDLLASSLGGMEAAASALKSMLTDPAPHPRWNAPNTDATNSVDFSALPAGIRLADSNYNGVGGIAKFWTADDLGSFDTYSIGLQEGTSIVTLDLINKASGASVRCVKVSK